MYYFYKFYKSITIPSRRFFVVYPPEIKVIFIVCNKITYILDQ